MKKRSCSFLGGGLQHDEEFQHPLVQQDISWVSSFYLSLFRGGQLRGQVAD
jgi:hypothetical protein